MSVTLACALAFVCPRNSLAQSLPDQDLPGDVSGRLPVILADEDLRTCYVENQSAPDGAPFITQACIAVLPMLTLAPAAAGGAVAGVGVTVEGVTPILLGIVALGTVMYAVYRVTHQAPPEAVPGELTPEEWNGLSGDANKILETRVVLLYESIAEFVKSGCNNIKHGVRVLKLTQLYLRMEMRRLDEHLLDISPVYAKITDKPMALKAQLTKFIPKKLNDEKLHSRCWEDNDKIWPRTGLATQ